jgi:hypothetical protein
MRDMPAAPRPLRPSIDLFTHIGKALGDTVLTSALLPPVHAAWLRITRFAH